MAKLKRQKLIHLHSGELKANKALEPSLLEKGEIAVRHANEEPELYIRKEDETLATFIDKVAVEKMVETVENSLQGQIDGITSDMEGYATSADTHAAIVAVDGKFASYATSADTHAAIVAVDGKFASYATSANTHAAIKSLTKGLSDLEAKHDETIDEINAKISSAYIYSGTVETFENLPSSATVGCVFNVEKAHDKYPAGTNYAWNGSAWDALGGFVDLTVFATSADTHAAIKAVDTAVSNLSSTLESDYATSADTHAAIVAVDGKFASYATSANTHAAIVAVDGKFASYATSANTHTTIKAVDTAVSNLSDALTPKVESLEASAVTKVTASTITTGEVFKKDGNVLTFDFDNLVIDCGEF